MRLHPFNHAPRIFASADFDTCVVASKTCAQHSSIVDALADDGSIRLTNAFQSKSLECIKDVSRYQRHRSWPQTKLKCIPNTDFAHEHFQLLSVSLSYSRFQMSRLASFFFFFRMRNTGDGRVYQAFS